jgi:hypothetical protein
MNSVRFIAARLLSISSSSSGETLAEIAEHVVDVKQRTGAVRLARRALTASIASGLRWREARADAEAKIRCGEIC